MDDNNNGNNGNNGNNIDKLGVEIFAKLADNFKSNINKATKDIDKIPESKTLRLETQANFGKINKEIRDQFKNWDNLMEHYSNNPKMRFKRLIGDTREQKDIIRTFTKIKQDAIKQFTDYQQELEKLQGKDYNNPNRTDKGEIGEITKSMEKQTEEYKKQQQTLDDLIRERDKLKAKKDELDLLPNTEKTLRDLQTARNKLQSLKRERENLNTYSKNKNEIRSKSEDILNLNEELAHYAAAETSRTGETSLWDKLSGKLNTRIKEQEDIQNSSQKKLMELRQSRGGVKGAITSKTKQLDDESLSDERKKILSDEISKLNEREAKLTTSIRDEETANLTSKELGKLYKNELKQAKKIYDERDNGTDPFVNNVKDYPTKRLPLRFADFTRKEGKADTDFTGFLSDIKTEDYTKSLNSQIEDYSSKISNIQKIQLPEAAKNDVKQQDNEKQLDNVNKEIKDQKSLIKNVNDELEKTMKLYNDMLERVEHINTEYTKLVNDVNSDPIKYQMDNEGMEKANKEVNGLVNKYNKLTTYMKKSNVFTRIGHRILINIRSQIAAMLNPLNLWNKGWNDWINRFENKQLKNTFEVIRYNLVTAFSGAFKMAAQLLLKITQIANIFTKKLVGVDLFASTDWKKNKAMVDNITASFDELHSVSDNNDTIFDSGNFKMDPINDKTKKRFEKLADFIKEHVAPVIKKAFDFAYQHPILTAAALLGAKLFGPALLKGTGKLLGKGILKLFGKGSKAEDAAEEGGSLLGSIFGKTLYTGMNGKAVTVGKLLGGIALVAAGTAIAISNAASVGKNWNDLTKKQKAVKVGFVGLGSVAAEVGAIMLGASGPVGWAVAGAVALTSFIVGMSQTQNGIKSVKKETKEWEEAQQNMKDALDEANQADMNYNESLANLKELQKETGESGKALYDAVQKGTLSTNDMTSAQLKVYNAYMQTKKALEEQTEARKKANEAVKTEAKEHADVLIANGKQSGSYDELAKHINECWKNGTMDTETARDEISRAMAGMSESAREEFLGKLQPALQEGLDYEKYQNGWIKFGENIKNLWQDIFGTADQSIANMKATEDDLIASTDALTAARNKLKEVQDNLSQAEQDAGMTYDELKAKIDNGEIAVNNLTDAQKKLYDAHIQVENSASQVDTALKKNEENLVGCAKQTYEAGGSWTDYVTKLKKACDDGQISTSTMETEIGDSLGKLKGKQKDYAEEWLRQNNLMSDGVEKSCKKQEGLFDRLYRTFGRLKQRLGNWFSGNGWNTDLEVDINKIENDNTLSDEEKKRKLNNLYNNIASYDVGTNYVPNDQLAMVHQGEAIIPAKYNKPYSGNNNSDLYETINNMTQEIAQLRQLINNGIPVKGEFKQRGSDLVATVEKAKNRNGNSVISNAAYAR